MATRLGLSLHMLRKLDSGACDSDARVLMKSSDGYNLSIVMRGEHVQLDVSGTRELRLLGKQLIAFANYLDGEYDFETEEIE